MLAAGRGSIVNFGCMSGFIINRPTLSHPLIFRRGEFATEGTHFDPEIPALRVFRLGILFRDDHGFGMSWALSRKISIGHFRHRIRPSASMIREQKQCSSSPAWRASRQYRIYSDKARRSTLALVTGALPAPVATLPAGPRIGTEFGA